MSSNYPSHPRNENQEPFGDLLKSMDDFFHFGPVRGFLQSMDELFKLPFKAFPIEVENYDDMQVVIAKLPGIKKEQIQIDLMHQYLTIKVKREETVMEEDEKKQTYKKSHSFQQMERSIYVGFPIDEKKVKATYKDGVLRVHIPKPKGKTIYIDHDS